MKHFRDRRGFTLIEMIVSVAVLAVAGVAVAALFVMAHVNNMKAVDLDQSVSRCAAFVEQIKAAEALYAADPQKDTPDIELFKQLKEKGSLSTGYNKNWERLDGVTVADFESELAYRITVQLHEMPEQDGLYMLEVASVKLKPYALSSKSDVELYRLSTVLEALPGEVTP